MFCTQPTRLLEIQRKNKTQHEATCFLHAIQVTSLVNLASQSCVKPNYRLFHGGNLVKVKKKKKNVSRKNSSQQSLKLKTPHSLFIVCIVCKNRILTSILNRILTPIGVEKASHKIKCLWLSLPL